MCGRYLELLPRNFTTPLFWEVKAIALLLCRSVALLLCWVCAMVVVVITTLRGRSTPLPVFTCCFTILISLHVRLQSTRLTTLRNCLHTEEQPCSCKTGRSCCFGYVTGGCTTAYCECVCAQDSQLDELQSRELSHTIQAQRKSAIRDFNLLKPMIDANPGDSHHSALHHSASRASVLCSCG